MVLTVVSLCRVTQCPAAFASCSDASPCYDHAIGCRVDGSIDTQTFPLCSLAIPFCHSCFPNSRCGAGNGTFQEEELFKEDGTAESTSQNDPAWLMTCAEGYKNSGFHIDKADRYSEWMDQNTTLVAKRIGSYQGPDDIKEYYSFVSSYTLDFINTTQDSTHIPIAYSKEECAVLSLFPIKTQVNTRYSKNGIGMCAEMLLAIMQVYNVDDADGNGFYLKSMFLDWPKKGLQSVFNGYGNEYPKSFCETFRNSCPLEYHENGLDDETCILKWNNLPEIGEEGLLDENNRGCRIIHSSFVATNDKHCPHVSFTPMADYRNKTKCDVSTTNLSDDVLPEQGLAAREALRLSLGFVSSLYRPCEYNTSWGEFSLSKEDPLLEGNHGEEEHDGDDEDEEDHINDSTIIMPGDDSSADGSSVFAELAVAALLVPFVL